MPVQSGDELTPIQTNLNSTLQHLFRLRRHRNSLASPLLRLPTELILKIFERATYPAHDDDEDEDDEDEDDEDEDDEDEDDEGEGDKDEDGKDEGHDGHDGHDDDDHNDDDHDDDDNDHDDSDCDDDSISTFPECRVALLVMVAICHKLRTIGITSPHLWSTVDFTIPSLAGLFLERCNYDPHHLIIGPSEERFDSIVYPRRDALLQLQGRAFSNLRGLVYEGRASEFKDIVAPILQGPTKIQVLSLQNLTFPAELPWYPSAPLPHLTDLRVREFSIDWTSTLLRNLTRLSLDCGFVHPTFMRPSVKTFLTALANCPDLESLELSNAGPDPPNGHLDNCDTMVVQLRRLRRVVLQSKGASVSGCTLSHIGYPESASVQVRASVDWAVDISRAISQVFPRGDSDTVKYLRRAKLLDIRVDEDAYAFSTDTSHFSFGDWAQGHPQGLSQAASKTLEVFGTDSIISLCMSITPCCIDLTDEIWETFLHALPQLARISYRRYGQEENRGVIDPFVLVLSRPFEGGPVCPKLQLLELPSEVLTREPSSTALKSALAGRNACGARLRWIGLSSGRPSEGDRLELEKFRGLADPIFW